MTDDIVKRLWRMADMNSADNDLSDITTAASHSVRALLSEIQQLKKKTNSVYNDWSDAICENSDLREKNAELRDEIDRLREALLKISKLEPEGPLGNDCMAVSYASETARAALEGEKTDTMRTLVYKINQQQAIAIAERDEFIEIMGMCNEFEEFLSK